MITTYHVFEMGVYLVSRSCMKQETMQSICTKYSYNIQMTVNQEGLDVNTVTENSPPKPNTQQEHSTTTKAITNWREPYSPL